MSPVAVLCALSLAAAVAGECLTEDYRPQYHFSPEKNWINDPNGLIYHDGEWHLFYQYEPYASVPSGNISWGHAVSSDLVHWEELPVAIEADAEEQIFSGSAVIDKDNSAGFGAGAMVAIYTAASKGADSIQAQAIAYSTDKGRTFTKCAGNPVLDLNMTQFRDPNVQWYEPGKHWLMAVSLPDDHKVVFYKSQDLKQWDKLSEFGPAGKYEGTQYECPDLFRLPVEGTQDEHKWILIVNVNPGGLQGGSAGQYFIGDFDGTKFTADDDQTRWLDVGKDNYAAITWKGNPDSATASYLIGWMSNWDYSRETPTSPWRNAMTLPRKLSLHAIDNKVVLKQIPVQALQTLRKSSSAATFAARAPSPTGLTLSNESVDVSEALSGRGSRPKRSFLDGLRGKAYHLSVTLAAPTASKSQGVKVRVGKDQYTRVVYDSENKTLSIDRVKSGDVAFDASFPGVHGGLVELRDNKLKLDVYVDWSSVEVFANEGELAITDTIFPDSTGDGVELFVHEGKGEFEGLKLEEFKTYRTC